MAGQLVDRHHVFAGRDRCLLVGSAAHDPQDTPRINPLPDPRLASDPRPPAVRTTKFDVEGAKRTGLSVT
jgi:hypothetical protein